jgi:hypothetical protein
MIDTGLYRNDVVGLSALSLVDYERIFKVFEKSVNDKTFYVYNTLKKIDFPEIDSQYLATYNVPSRMPMTLLSYKIYGDLKSWWILYLLNRNVFEGAPFYVNGGEQLKYILPSIVGLVYLDITKGTVFGGRHY